MAAKPNIIVSLHSEPKKDSCGGNCNAVVRTFAIAQLRVGWGANSAFSGSVVTGNNVAKANIGLFSCPGKDVDACTQLFSCGHLWSNTL